VRWSRPVLWAERAVAVPAKLRALIYGALGITVLNLTLALFTSYTQTMATMPVATWVEPNEQTRIETLFDDDNKGAVGYRYTNLINQTTCTTKTQGASYTCESRNLRR